MHYAGAEHPGGLLAHLLTLARGLSELKHEIDLILAPSRSVEPVAQAGIQAGARVTRLTVRGKTDLSGALMLRNVVSERRPDVFHLHLSSPIEAVPALMAARWGGARHVVTTEYSPTWFPLRRSYSRMIKIAASRWIDAVVAVSQSDADFLRTEFGVPGSRIRVIPNGVDPPEEPRIGRDEARRRLGLEDAPAWLLGCAADLEPKKGISDLVEAFDRETPVAAGLVIAGTGSLQEALSEKSRESDGRIILLGRVDGISTFLSAVDAFAIASHQEAMPLTLLEAMWAALPIVATTVGGIPEAIEDGASGLLVAPCHPDALAAAIRRLHDDPAGARALGAAARERAERRFSSRRMIAETVALYEGLG